MHNREEYIKQLEAIISKFLEPLKGIPYPIAIRALTGCEVLHFDLSCGDNQKLLNLLKNAAKIAGNEAYKQGIFTRRPNEAGNHIEPFVISALRKVGLRADKPRTKSGKIKVAGYPDIEIIDKQGRVIYLDCKTYNTATKNQSFRTFYFSPSKDPKITKDAFHLLLSFELTREERKGQIAFIPISWQLYTLENLKVQVKHEFNASNKDLYKPEFLLARGKIK
ncbi:MAG: hypothetical protein OD815_001735 [Candidatus Alkanophagales archaeon MCA70_species_2]|nr:hypothetical protein [Candidatus Alkanophaga liquidiphilum]